jgi:hypothetical protein
VPALADHAAPRPHAPPPVPACARTLPSPGALRAAGPQLDVPHDITPTQLETLLNGLLKTDEPLPYAFYIDGAELSSELGEHLSKAKARPAHLEAAPRQPPPPAALQACVDHTRAHFRGPGSRQHQRAPPWQTTPPHTHPLPAAQVSVESLLRITYQPQALFRVRPVARCSASMPGHAESVLCVAFSPDGRQLASGSGDSTLRLWDLATQTPLHTCQVGGGRGPAAVGPGRVAQGAQAS